MAGTTANLIRRLVTGSFLIAFVTGVLFYAPLWLFGVVTAAFTGLALNEFFVMAQRKGIWTERWIGLLIGLAIPLSICWRFEPTKGWELLFVSMAFLTLFVLQLRRKDISQTVVGVSTALFGIFYIAWCFSFLVRLRFLEGAGLPSGQWLVAYLVAVTKSGDIGAWAVGSALGRTPLIQRISPSKTWEGLVGGLLFSAWVAGLFRSIFPQVAWVELVVLGFVLGGIGQLGDLFESMVKRDCQVKDSGNILPGMGGMLDLLDSLLFTAPFCYFYIRAFWG